MQQSTRYTDMANVLLLSWALQCPRTREQKLTFPCTFYYVKLLHDNIQVQRHSHANILALCMGRSCHFIFYHDLAQLTIYGTTAKWPICICRHRYIINHAASASSWGEWRLFEVRMDRSSASTYCRGRIAFFCGARAAKLSLLAAWYAI